MLLAGTLAFITIPSVTALGLIVSMFPSALRLMPFAVSAMVRVLIVMSAPSTVPVAGTTGVVLGMITSAPAPGTRNCVAPPAEEAQLLWLPLVAAHDFVSPGVAVPRQKAAVSAVAALGVTITEVAVLATLRV